MTQYSQYLAIDLALVQRAVVLCGRNRLLLMATRVRRQQFPGHQLPHGRDAPPQAHRLHHLLHGGDRQGDLRDEARHQLQGTDLRRGLPQRVQEQGKLSRSI